MHVLEGTAELVVLLAAVVVEDVSVLVTNELLLDVVDDLAVEEVAEDVLEVLVPVPPLSEPEA